VISEEREREFFILTFTTK